MMKFSLLTKLLITLFLSVFAYGDTTNENSLSFVTWNLNGPSGLDGKDFEGLADFVHDTDIVVMQEVLGEVQAQCALKHINFEDYNFAISNFSNDTQANAHYKIEVLVATKLGIDKVIEVDPDPSGETPEMQEEDYDLVVPEWLPERMVGSSKLYRGWLWSEIPSKQLVVVAVHLRSSQGKSGKQDFVNSEFREMVSAALVETIKNDSESRQDWSYIVIGDFNVAPTDSNKVGPIFSAKCDDSECVGYDQTHAIFSSGLANGFAMRNLTNGLSASYAKGNYAKSPIDNIYAYGPIFDEVTKLSTERAGPFGSDHYAIKVKLEY